MNKETRANFIKDFPSRISRSGSGYWRVYTTTNRAGGKKRTAIALADPGSKTRIQSVCQFTFNGDAELASALAVFADNKQCIDDTAFESAFRLWLSGQGKEADVEAYDNDVHDEAAVTEKEQTDDEGGAYLVDDIDPIVVTAKKRKILPALPMPKPGDHLTSIEMRIFGKAYKDMTKNMAWMERIEKLEDELELPKPSNHDHEPTCPEN